MAWADKTQAAADAEAQATAESQGLLTSALHQRRQTASQMQIENLVDQ